MASSPALGFLIACAKAIEDGDLENADWLLHRILNAADKERNACQSRVVKHFAEALVCRAYGLHPTRSYNTLQAHREYYYDYGSCNIDGIIRETISNVLVLMGKKRFHIIDFYIPCWYGGSVLKTLPKSKDDPLSVRVSILLSPIWAKQVDFCWDTDGLLDEAWDLNIELENEGKVLYGNSLGSVDESELDFKTREDETTLVFYTLKLSRLLKDTAAVEREFVRLREINPALVVMIEFYCNHKQSNFLTCLEDSFRYYYDLVGDEDNRDVNVIKWFQSEPMHTEVEDLLMRHKTLTEWKHIFSMGGFGQVPLTDSQGIRVDRGLEILREEAGCLVLGEKQLPLLFVSAWKPHVEDQQFNGNLSLRRHKFGTDFDSSALLDTKIPLLQPLSPFSQGLALNQLAAFVEIHDILHHICHKYDIPLALTWASTDDDMKENKSDPYKNHTLCIQREYIHMSVWNVSYPYKNHTLLIQSNACYVKDWGSYFFMKVYAEAIHIKSGQSIAGKALESSEGFFIEPSIRNICVGDDRFLARTEDYDIDSAAAICVQNCYTTNEVYVVEFFWKSGKPQDLAFHVFNELKSMNKKFVTVRVQDTEVGFQEKAWDVVDAVEINVFHHQWKDIQSATLQNSSSHVAIAPLNTQEGSHDQIISSGDSEILKENKSPLEQSRNKYRKPWSKVWLDFDKFEVDGKPVAKCKHCSKEFSGSSKSGTTHLKNHLDRCPVKKKQNQERELTCPTGTDGRSITFDQEKSRLDFAKLIIKNPCLLDVADQELFKSFVAGVQPMFQFQSKDAWLSYIRHIYKEEKEKLKLYFDRLACKLHLTVNLWKNNRGKTAYCCLIAHFIDDDWKLKNKFLSFNTLDCIYDTKALAGIIRSSVAEWNIGKKVCSITVDNSSLDDDMVRQIKESCLTDQDSLSSAHWFISCTLLEYGLREIDDILLKLRKSIEYVSETTHGKLRFQETAEKMKLQDRKSSYDVSFRLDSDFDILDSSLGSREIFCQLELIDDNFKLNPSMEEWEKAVALHSCLKCFDDIKGTQSLTKDLYFPKLCDIYMRFLQLEKRNHPIITLMKSKFDNYWSLCNLALALAAVLDPRLNFRFLQISYNIIYGHDSKIQLNRFRKVLTDVYDEYVNEAKNLTKSASNMENFNSSIPDTGNVRILDYFCKIVSESNFNEDISSKSELECYLDEPLLPLDGAFFDILAWWHVKSQTFPTLARMARDLLAMPISIFSPCPDFSAMIMNPACRSLNPDNMEAFVCNQNWLETPNEDDGKNHVPIRNTEKRKRKMDEDTNALKVTKTLNHDNVNITRDIAKDSSKNDVSPCFDNRLVPQFSSSEFVNGKTEIVEASNAQQKLRLLQPLEPNHRRDINVLCEISDDDTSFDNNLSDMSLSSSSESDDEAPLKQQGSWCKEDVRAYFISSFTINEEVRRLLDKVQKNELNGKSIGRDKEFRVKSDKLAPLLMVPHGNEDRKKYYIDDSVVNTFFKLLKKRSERFPDAYIHHYSFDSQIATYLTDGSKSEHEVLAWFKTEKLAGVHKLFLPLCLSSHWVLFYVDTKDKKISWLDSIPSSRITSNNVEKQKILHWFTSFLLPYFGYTDAHEWPFVIRTDIPVQKNLVDCGVFVMKYGDCLVHGEFFPFTQDDMVRFRREIFLDIYHGRLHTKK